MPEEFNNMNVEEVHVVLEKFEGDPADGILAERLTIVNGEIVEHEVFDVTDTVGGVSNSRN